MPSPDPATEGLYLSLDQGGHASRAVVFDAAGRARARAVHAVAVRSPRPDWVEQDAEELLASLRECAARALRAAPGAVRGAGLVTQRSSIVCWDRSTGEALSPVLSWQDRRTQDGLRDYADRSQAIRDRTGLRLSPHYGASKLRWCLDHLVPVQRARRAGRLAMGPLAAFLVFRLLAERPLLVDPADAARMLLCDLETLGWAPELLAIFGVPAELLPAICPSRYGFGRLPTDAGPVPLQVVNGDQPAALFAAGAPRPDIGYVNVGTGAFVQRLIVGPVKADPELLTGIVLHDEPRRWYAREGTVNGAGAALSWARESLALPDLAQRLGPWLARGAEPPLFLNGVGGLGAPYWVPDFPSRFLGPGEPWQRAVAVAESIVFLLQENIARLQADAPLTELRVSGGLSAHDGLCQRLADLSGLGVYRPLEREASARGLGYLLAGNPPSWPEPPEGTWFQAQPNPALHRRYRRWCQAMADALGGQR